MLDVSLLSTFPGLGNPVEYLHTQKIKVKYVKISTEMVNTYRLHACMFFCCVKLLQYAFFRKGTTFKKVTALELITCACIRIYMRTKYGMLG